MISPTGLAMPVTFTAASLRIIEEESAYSREKSRPVVIFHFTVLPNSGSTFTFRKKITSPGSLPRQSIELLLLKLVVGWDDLDIDEAAPLLKTSSRNAT